MDQIQHLVQVTAQEKLCDRFYRLCVDAPAIQKEAKPGQFIHIRVGDSLEPFFRRPFSIYRAQKDIEIFYEPVGPGTKILAAKKPGDTLDILGPLGVPFTLPDSSVKRVVMIAGGIGIAPFLFLSDILKNKNLELNLLYGGRTQGHVYPMKEFKDNGVKVHVATDDGSVGTKGRVSVFFDQWDPATTMIYTCGPNPMMAAVQKFAVENHLKGEAACEEVMACALGACLGCSIQTKSGYRTVCYDGPVFPIEQPVFH